MAISKGKYQPMDPDRGSKRPRSRGSRQKNPQEFVAGSRSKTRAQGSRRKVARPTVGLSLLSRIVARIGRLDWRYKIQIILAYSLAMMIAMYLLRPHLADLGNWGYLGAFIINGASNATIIFPAPGGALVAVMAKDFNPTLLGVAAGVGGTLGSLTAYLAGAVNSADVGRSRWGNALQRVMQRLGGLIIFFFSLIPFLPADVSGVIAGMTRYPLRKYLLFHGMGSVIQMIVFVHIGVRLLDFVEEHIVEWFRSVW